MHVQGNIEKALQPNALAALNSTNSEVKHADAWDLPIYIESN